MRLWSIHPSYLDSVGLTACWREALLARKVLAGDTRGYKNHPQLLRFKQSSTPMEAIAAYLCAIHEESLRRGYNYDKSKIKEVAIDPKIPVTRGQLQYEFDHLKNKLHERNLVQYNKLLSVEDIIPNRLFTVVDGEIEDWEIIG